jgi:hypothetical protein
MNAREMELIKFCEEQKVDEEISKKFREASEKEAEELIRKWLSMEDGTLNSMVGSYDYEVVVWADMRSKKDKETAFDTIHKCMQTGYNKKLQFVGVYNELLNKVVIHFWRMNDIDIRITNVTVFVQEGELNKLCKQLNAFME